LYRGTFVSGDHRTFLVVAVLAILAYAWRRPRDPLILTLFVSTGLLAILGYRSIYPFSGNRQCLMAMITILPVVAIGISLALASRRRSLQAVSAAAAFVVLAIGTKESVAAASQTASPLRNAIALINERSGASDVVFVTPGTYPQFVFYSRQLRRSAVLAEGSDDWMRDERFWRDRTANPPYLRQLQDLVGSGSPLWIIESHTHPGEPSIPLISERQGWSERLQNVFESPLPSDNTRLVRLLRVDSTARTAASQVDASISR
jgi:hypothetical protein